MFGNSHDLNRVVTKLMYSREYIICELIEGMDSRLDACHTNVCFIDLRCVMFLGSFIAKHELLRLIDIQDWVVQNRLLVLH